MKLCIIFWDINLNINACLRVKLEGHVVGGGRTQNFAIEENVARVQKTALACTMY